MIVEAHITDVQPADPAHSRDRGTYTMGRGCLLPELHLAHSENIAHGAAVSSSGSTREQGGTMQILIRCVAEKDGDDVSSELFDWLVDDDAVRKNAAPELLADPPKPGHLGTVAVVQLVLSGAFSATSLGVVLAQWREQRRLAAAPKITVTVEKAGKTFAVTGSDPDEIQRKLDELDAA